jgi:hypothetical protein
MVGARQHAPEKNCGGDKNTLKNQYPAWTPVELAAYPYSLDLFFANSLPSFIGERHNRF